MRILSCNVWMLVGVRCGSVVVANQLFVNHICTNEAVHRVFVPSSHGYILLHQVIHVSVSQWLSVWPWLGSN